MNPSTRSSSFSPRLVILLASIGLASVTVPLAAEEPAAPATPKVAVPIVSSDATVQKGLVELDQLLDIHPKFEEILRANLDRLDAQEFRTANPDIDIVLKQRPEIVRALKAERHFLVHRTVARLARGPVMRADVVALDEFMAAHPNIRQALEKDTTQIVQPDFLIAHPPLADFFTAHPSLSTVLLKKQVAPGKHKKS